MRRKSKLFVIHIKSRVVSFKQGVAYNPILASLIYVELKSTASTTFCDVMLGKHLNPVSTDE